MKRPTHTNGIRTTMVPPTKHGLPTFACLSALQKAIRRGEERMAMEHACELIHTSKAHATMVTNRLQVVSHEDVCTATSPHIVPFVKAACDQAKEWWDADNPGKSRMAVGNAIRMMCRAPKSREGDHFQAAVGLKSLLTGYKPTIPDWANDGHTLAGKKLGRGLDFFRSTSTLLDKPPAEKDAYEDAAFEMWALKEQKGIK
jgi:replication-associated recombination protein RarA